MSTSLIKSLTSKFYFNKFGLILSKYGYKVKKNDILAGVIVGIEPNYVLVDLGLKQICFLPLKELSINDISDPRDLLMINFIGEFLILNIIKNPRKIILSIKRVKSVYLWNRLRQLDFKNMTIYAKLEKFLPRGKKAIFNGLAFFVLNSNLPKYYLRRDNKNLFMPFQFLEIKDYFHIAHISSKIAIFKKVNKNLTLKSFYIGTVISISKFGIFVNILGIKCLLHISKISRKRKNLADLNSSYKTGDQLSLQIIYKDIKRGRVAVAL
uniref:30S ribosomal protein S1 n=1 Tax=Ascoseira mirabilis TaxID=76830 RepID=UPI0030029525|nr:30S ribosomal protein S1 [Ascoseira mirabilis]